MEAIVLAGGKAERLGDVAGGLPKSLVPVGGRPLLAWQVGRLAAAGVDRVIISCVGGQEDVFPYPQEIRFCNQTHTQPVITGE